MLQNEYKEYNLFTNNCQDYVDDVIAVANMLAEKNNDTLEIDEQTYIWYILLKMISKRRPYNNINKKNNELRWDVYNKTENIFKNRKWCFLYFST